MRQGSSAIVSRHTTNLKLPKITFDQKHLPNIIRDHVSEINQEMSNLDNEHYHMPLRNSLSHRKLSKAKSRQKNRTVIKSTQIIPNAIRLNSFETKPISSSTTIDNRKIYKTTTSLPCPKSSFKKFKILKELNSIEEETAYVNKNLLSDLVTYAETDKKMNRQFNKIKTLKQKLLFDTDEYLQPELTKNPFHKRHSDVFYSGLDHVIKKVNDSSSIDLFEKMKVINQEKENKNNKILFTKQNWHQRVVKILDESSKISNRISKRC